MKLEALIFLIWMLSLSLAIQIVFFIPAYFLRTDKFTDFSYGLTFVILALFAFCQSNMAGIKLALLFMVIVWAVRLTAYLVIRIRKMGKDNRFDNVRSRFWSFLSFWILQGFGAWIVSIPGLLFFFDESSDFSIISVLGALVWLSGVLIESAADYQKYQFKNNPKNKDKWIATGLWKYSRHPNYFGEFLCWVGIYVFTFSDLSFHQQLLGLLSPLFILFILLFVTGIPKLEEEADRKWGNLKEYRKYRAATSVFAIMPVKKR